MTPTLTRLLEAIEYEKSNCDLYDNRTPSESGWEKIIELAAKVRAELNSVPQEDVAGRMERE